MPEPNPQKRLGRVKRAALVGVLLLGAGALVNVAVAWGCCWRWGRWDTIDKPTLRDSGVFTPSGAWLEYSVMRDPGCTRIAWSAGLSHPALDPARRERMNAPPPRWALVPRLPGYQRADVNDHPIHRNHVEVGCGFPFVSMAWCARRFDIAPGLDFVTPMIRVENPFPNAVPPAQPTERILPVHPLLIGFAANTFIYAAIVALLFFAPGAIRRRVRRRRGQCEKCAYPIGVSPVCTECGAAVGIVQNRTSKPAA